jgi:hypothetical protein
VLRPLRDAAGWIRRAISLGDNSPWPPLSHRYHLLPGPTVKRIAPSGMAVCTVCIGATVAPGTDNRRLLTVPAVPAVPLAAPFPPFSIGALISARASAALPETPFPSFGDGGPASTPHSFQPSWGKEVFEALLSLSLAKFAHPAHRAGGRNTSRGKACGWGRPLQAPPGGRPGGRKLRLHQHSVVYHAVRGVRRSVVLARTVLPYFVSAYPFVLDWSPCTSLLFGYAS